MCCPSWGWFGTFEDLAVDMDMDHDDQSSHCHLQRRVELSLFRFCALPTELIRKYEVKDWTVEMTPNLRALVAPCDSWDLNIESCAIPGLFKITRRLMIPLAWNSVMSHCLDRMHSHNYSALRLPITWFRYRMNLNLVFNHYLHWTATHAPRPFVRQLQTDRQ